MLEGMHVEDVDGGAEHEDEEHQDGGQHEVDGAEPLHALVQAGEGGEDEGRRQGADDDQLQGDGVLDAGREVQPLGDLERAETEAGGGAEDRGEHRQQVDGPAGRAARPFLADQGDEGGAEAVAAALAEGRVGQGEAGDAVDRPGGEGPVEEGVLHGREGGGAGGGGRPGGRGRGQVMGEGSPTP